MSYRKLSLQDMRLKSYQDLDPGYREYCNTPGQVEAFDTVKESTSLSEAARRLNINVGALHNKIASIINRAHRKGFAPEIGVVAEQLNHLEVKGVSRLYDEAGNTKMTWVKSDRKAEHLREMMEAVIEGMREEIPREPPAPCGHLLGKAAERMLNLYIITDYHFGAYAWGEETKGEDWDTDLAEKLLTEWFRDAIYRSPEAKVGVLCNLGDMIHFDGLEAVTPTSRNVLDSDTRFQRVIRVAIRVIRRVVNMMLQKHELVHLVMAEGNHDIASSAWLREFFHLLFENDTRVTVDTSVDPYYSYEWGQTALFFHHGHLRKPEQVDRVFAAKFRELFGRTKHNYGHMGHMHHRTALESQLMVIEQHRTLAAADAYASRGGWVSGRDAAVITYDKEFGEVSRLIISPKMARGS